MKKIIFITLLIGNTLNPLVAQCTGVIPPFSLGNDTTICQGSSLVLTPGNIFDTYLWDNNSTNPTRTVSQAGTYTVTVGMTGTNIITNGNFSSGNTNFSTDYGPGTGGSYGLLSNEGQYAISTSPSLVHNNFTPCGDHTSGSGNMLIANGAGTPNTNVWCQTVAVTPNTDYLFSCWITNAINTTNVANLQFYVNGSPIGSVFSTSPTGCSWQQYDDIWNSGALTTANICIVNQNTTSAGNDFAIDDISFAPLCYESDMIVVTTNPTPTISAPPVNPICKGASVQLNASSATSNLTYTWTPGPIVGQSINVSPSTSTVYSVTATSSFGCTSNLISVPVIINQPPPLSISVPNSTICFGSNAQLTANSNASATFEWSPIVNNTNTVNVSPVVNTTYSVTATGSNGCQITDSVLIAVIQPLNITITGETTFCEGSSTVLTASGDQANINFFWPNTGNSATTQFVDESIEGWIVLEGSVSNCPVTRDSIFTESIAIPSLQVPSDFVTCPGETVIATVSSDVPNATFVWSPGNLSGTTNSIAMNETSTFYVYAQNGQCVSPTQSFTIETSMICALEIPNVFSPNGDLINDYFSLISHQGIATLECTILNRWGNVVAAFDTPNFMWNGSDQHGNLSKEGVYFYTIKAVTNAGEELDKHGFVQLVN